MDPTNLPDRTTPHWDLYRRDMFMLAAEQKHPLFSTDPDELEQLAKQKLSEGGWLYASSNAGNSFTHRANREGKELPFVRILGENAKALPCFRSVLPVGLTYSTPEDPTRPFHESLLILTDNESCPGCLLTQMQETLLPSYLDTKSRRLSASLLSGSM
jgi:hypothetical protein